MTLAVFRKFMPAMEHPNTDLYPWGGPYTSVCTWLLETCTWEPENYNMVLNALFGHSHINAHYRSILLRPCIHGGPP